MPDKIKNFGSPSREKGFTMAAELFRQNGGKLIVETGCYWYEPQGESTLHLAELAAEVGGEFHSVDIDPAHVEISRKLVAHIPNATIHCSDSLKWLGETNFSRPIDFLYLDAFDFQQDHPNILSIYNVAELGSCIGRMAEHSVILMDDWNSGEGDWRKCILSKELLLYRGWKLVNEDYQLLFSR